MTIVMQGFGLSPGSGGATANVVMPASGVRMTTIRLSVSLLPRQSIAALPLVMNARLAEGTLAASLSGRLTATLQNNNLKVILP